MGKNTGVGQGKKVQAEKENKQTFSKGKDDSDDSESADDLSSGHNAEKSPKRRNMTRNNTRHALVRKTTEVKPKSRKSGILQSSAGGVVLLIFVYGCYIGKNFYDIAHPKFPVMDHTGKLWPKFGNRIDVGTPLHLKVFLADDTKRFDLSEHSSIWEKKFIYDWETFEGGETNVPIRIRQDLLDKGKNLDIWAVIFSQDSKEVLTHSKGGVIKYIKPPPKVPTYNLLANTECPAPDEKKYGNKQQLARGIPKMQLRFVDDQTEYPSIVGVNKPYVPPIFVDEFWLTDDQLVKLNTTGENRFELLLHFDLMSSARWHFQKEMSQRITNAAKSFGEDSEEILQMRDLFANTSAWLLILTFVVSVLHSIFEYLAFKNDIIFWKNQSADDLNQFVSVQSVFFGIFCQIIVLLYLWDESANFLVLITSLASIFVDVWKVSRALKPKIGWLFKVIPYPSFVSRAQRKKVDNFDSQAMKFLTLLISPFLFAYAVYALTQSCHKGWYSYAVSTTASCVYSLGFILMTPQLFINYKYKTVQFLPWRRFIYRAINTFIDDLFSFIIRMPTMHRLSCFRDDVVFFIYLYQRWIYPVDKTRLFDEEGYEVESTEKKKEE